MELPTKVQEWRDRSRAQKEAGQPSAPAGDHPPGIEEEGQSLGLGKWMKQDITVDDVEMTIAVEEERTKNEWLNIVSKHEGTRVSNEHKGIPAGLAHEDMILRAAYERHEREMEELERTYIGLRKILQCKDKEQCKDRNCDFRHGDQPQGKDSFKQWVKDQNQKRSKVSQNTSFHPPAPYCSPLMQSDKWDGKKIIDKYKLPGRGEDSPIEFVPVAEKEVEFKKKTLEEWRTLNKARILVIAEEIYGHYAK